MPEIFLQNDCQRILENKGWLVLRAGFDGYPDLIALHPSGQGKGWQSGKRIPGWHYIRWNGIGLVNVRKFPYGLNLSTDLRETKLFMEFKTPIGRISKRQQGVVNFLSRLGYSGIVASFRQFECLVRDIPENLLP